jgi:hypothetical protein
MVIANMSDSCRNAIGSHVIHDSDSLPTNIYIHFIFIMLIVKMSAVVIRIDHQFLKPTKYRDSLYLLMHMNIRANKPNC